MKSILKRIYNIQSEYILAHFEKIKVSSGRGLFNLRCFSNVVQYAKEKKQSHIVLVFILDGKQVILHCVNIDSKGRYIENTLGYQSEDWDYFFVKRIEAEFGSANSTFKEMRSFMKRITPWYLRWSKHSEV